MNQSKSFRLTVCLMLTMLFLNACGAPIITQPTSTPIPPTATPITEIDSENLHSTWGVRSLCTVFGDMAIKFVAPYTARIDPKGDITIEFGFDNPPKVTFVREQTEEYFMFNTPMPNGNTAGKVIFVTPTVKGATAKIPQFTPTLDNYREATSYLIGRKFLDYEGDFDFRVGLVLRTDIGLLMVDSNLFYNGAEHYIFGEVELFGVKFTNNSKEPLVFKIDGDKYVYIEGNGVATTKDGAKIEFSK